MSRYAATTEVSVAKSKMEIESTLTRYGASAFGYATEGTRAQVKFKAHGRFVQFVLPLPDPEEDRFIYGTRAGRCTYNARTEDARAKAYEQAQRQVWRALALVIKAKLEAVDAGITSFEDEFLAHTLLPNGETVGVWMQPQIEEAYTNGVMPSSLIALSGGKA